MSKAIRTWTVFAMVGTALVCGQAAAAQQLPDFSKVQIKVTKFDRVSFPVPYSHKCNQEFDNEQQEVLD